MERDWTHERKKEQRKLHTPQNSTSTLSSAFCFYSYIWKIFITQYPIFFHCQPAIFFHMQICKTVRGHVFGDIPIHFTSTAVLNGSSDGRKCRIYEGLLHSPDFEGFGRPRRKRKGKRRKVGWFASCERGKWDHFTSTHSTLPSLFHPCHFSAFVNAL